MNDLLKKAAVCLCALGIFPYLTGCSDEISTMSAYEMSTAVTSADSTAASLSKEIQNFLESQNENFNGAAFFTFSIEDGYGSWDCEINDLTDSGDFIGYSEALTRNLMNLFPDIERGVVKTFVSGKECIAVAYTSGTSEADKLEFGKIFTDLENEESAGTVTEITTKTCAWNGETAGIGGSGMGKSEGLVIGTSPKLTLS